MSPAAKLLPARPTFGPAASLHTDPPKSNDYGYEARPLAEAPQLALTRLASFGLIQAAA